MAKQVIQPVRGTRDYIGTEMQYFRHVVDSAREVARRFNIKEMQSPIFEFSEVFHRSLGESSDVVSKETYTFADRGGESITLRPECTAAVVRAFISNGLTQRLPFKAFYAGPAFRYERPQKGRMRQFHQIGVECLGATDPWQDVEVIACAADVLTRILGRSFREADIVLELNTLGDMESRKQYRERLVTYLQHYRGDLSQESQARLERNPLRILDSKQEQDREIIAGAPLLRDALNDRSREWFDQVCASLEQLGIAYQISSHLVRGLDYYTHTVFEFTSQQLGSQATVLAGGRYDGLVAQLGGPDIPGVGWAAGVERLMLLLQQEEKELPAAPLLVITPTSPEHEAYAMQLAMNIRRASAEPLSVEILPQRHIGKAVKKANTLGASHFIALGDEEVASGRLRLRDLNAGDERTGLLPEEIPGQIATSCAVTSQE